MSSITENKNVPVCAVTGAKGYLGSRVKAYFQAQGWKVHALSRQAKAPQTTQELTLPFTLGDPLEPALLQGVSVLVHCAYDFRARTWAEIERINVQGSIQLLQAAHAAGVTRIVLISTMSAFEGCQSLYGRAKLAVEQEAQRLGAVILRPGLIYGREAGGMVGALNKMISLSNLLPLVGDGNYPLYLIHEADLCQMIFALSATTVKAAQEPIIAAADRPLTFKQILQELAAARGQRLKLIPFPWQVMWAGLKCGELLKLPLGFRSDSLLSLINQDRTPDFSLTYQTGITPRVFQAQAVA